MFAVLVVSSCVSYRTSSSSSALEFCCCCMFVRVDVHNTAQYHKCLTMHITPRGLPTTRAVEFDGEKPNGPTSCIAMHDGNFHTNTRHE